ncbi:MBL fold metallo-hydrolase [Bacillus sp. FJAT-49870]|uniref:MBL fold metallo-hydrolase n=1 Tax=Lederbergia citri TaxID=2833580 RepID=A0A942YIY2_9BACI|nr:ComEC/Rec2 family competence protein [Lederbergia citri]MBS4197494.1 MBL fold metallo-hydrolase [Lederbergia citri]
MKRKTRIIGIVAALFLSLFFAQYITSAASKDLVVHFIDVGQGDSIFIKTPQGESILIDAGNRAKGHDVVAYLKKQNVNTINYMIATHPDSDHIGGLDEVINAFKVDNIYAPKVSHTTQAYKDFLNAVKDKNYKIKTAASGVKLPLKDKTVTASFLAPVKSYSTSDLNNWSAVLHVKYNKNTFLFTGDIESKGEKDLISKKLLSKVDVLKVSHHGAKEATTTEFLNIVKPNFAVISVGKGNRYKHPTTETLKRLTAVKANIYRTDLSGTITATSNGTTIKMNEKPTQVKEPVANTSNKLTASVDNKTPKQNSTINLSVNGLPKGTKYTAIFHYKSTNTTYYGKVGEKLPVKISRAAIGFNVKVDISASYNGKTYKTQTSFTPK